MVFITCLLEGINKGRGTGAERVYQKDRAAFNAQENIDFHIF